ncbi:TetR/AcrR family transcriptional regulator [Seongchinamella unica]|uniref:TetR/AcrR family transcriptional regulator n=1 Tax=Seongchinamella unica TaxID=2547392 RepID=A0A4R5LRM9_9GAMM|nr:TetR/AcrR family transcriptional regulator [Seongchinamella unica]TDG13367.1 TetR/AcrR family transcriptional regulator [Seongchinamella unica]
MSEPVKPEVVDGRRARSERSKQAIIDASLALMEEGNLIPTAQQISDKAGVGIRSFFRHFEDMETLFATIDEQIRASTEALFLGGDRDGTLEERILHAIERHGEGYEKQRNMILSTSAQLWRSETLRRNYARYQRGLRRDLDDWLPELKQLTRSQREAVDAIASFEMWHRLRYHQGLSNKSTIEVLVSLINLQLKG